MVCVREIERQLHFNADSALKCLDHTHIEASHAQDKICDNHTPLTDTQNIIPPDTLILFLAHQQKVSTCIHTFDRWSSNMC